MRTWSDIVSPKDFDPRLVAIHDKINLYLRDLSAGMGKITQGDKPNQSGDPINDADNDLFFKLKGRPGGQIGHGATEASGNLTLASTFHDTKGLIYFGNAEESAYDETNTRLGLNTAAPEATLHVEGEPPSVAIYVPNSVTIIGGWSDESLGAPSAGDVNTYPVQDDTLYLNSNGSGTLELGLPTIPDPGAGTITIKIRARSAGVNTGLNAFLIGYPGSSTIATFSTSSSALTGSFPTWPTTTISYTLSASEVTALLATSSATIRMSRFAGINVHVTDVWIEVSGGGSGGKTVIVRAGASQTDSLTEWQNSSDTALVTVTAAGRLTVESGGTFRHVPGAAASTLFQGDSDGDGSWGKIAFLSAYHSDVVAASPVLGDLVYANSTPAWQKLAGNTTTTRNFLRQVGNGSISAAPAWDTLQVGDIPAALAGWTDDGTVVRLTTSTDTVGIGTTTPSARLNVTNSNAASTDVLRLVGAASQSGSMISARNNSGRNLMSLIGATINLGNSTDSSVPAVITFGQDNASFAGPTITALNWGENNSNLGDPATTADQVGCVGARFYPYKDSTGLFDCAYGQSFTEAWVLAGPSTVPYVFYTGRHPSTPFKRWEITGDGDQTNYGLISIRKNAGPTPSTPELRLEETGSGANYTALRAASAITTDHAYVFPSAIANGIFNNSVSGSTGTLSMLTAVRGDILIGNSTPAWAKLAIGGNKTVVGSDGTDPSWVSLDASYLPDRTRREWLPGSHWVQSNGTTMTRSFSGTYPNHYASWLFVDAPGIGPQALHTAWRVPKGYVSGGTIKIFYTAEGLSDGTYHPRAHYLAVNEVASNVGSGQESMRGTRTTLEVTTSDLLLATTGGAVQAVYRQATIDVGTMTGLAENDLVLIDIDRDTTQDTYPDTIRFVGVAIDYTSDM